VPKPQAEQQAVATLTALGMDSFQKLHTVSTVGGATTASGHCTRLVPWAKVLMLDEPSSALDPDNTKVLANC